MSVLLAGALVDVPGLRSHPPASRGGPPWCRLGPDDYRMRRAWIRQLIVHTTGGHWPQVVVPGAGPSGHAEEIADMWRGADRGGGERVHSGAHAVVDFDGQLYCLADLSDVEAYHAEGSNPWSVGVEMCTRPDGAVYQATVDALVALARRLCWLDEPGLLPIPAQTQTRYAGAPLPRMETGSGASRRNLGGPTCCGVLGHRHNTSTRGRGDPGDAVFAALAATGFETPDFYAGEDLAVGAGRQRHLASLGEGLTVDGVVGPATLAAAARRGYARWRDVPTL